VILNMLLMEVIFKTVTLFYIASEEFIYSVREKKVVVLMNEVILSRLSKIFTPNNDGYKDYWHIRN
jgi:hypothetical protein